MKQSLILKQHVPFASMLYKALEFSELMLKQSHVLFPFAVLTIENDMQCVFAPCAGQDPTPGLIEDLQTRISERKLFAETAVSLLVYSATIMHPSGEETDALVFTITDSAGKNNVTIYPYTFTESGISIDKPYTCDFSD